MEFGFCAVDVLVPLFWVFECVIASVVLLILFAFWLQLRCAVWLLLLVVNTAVVMYLLGWYPVVVVLVVMNWFNCCERSGATRTQYYSTTLRCFSVLQLDSSWNEQMCKTERERELRDMQQWKRRKALTFLTRDSRAHSVNQCAQVRMWRCRKERKSLTLHMCLKEIVHG